MFDIRFPSQHLVTKLIATLILTSSYPRWFPLPHIPLHFSSIHSSDWQLYDTTLYHQASPTLCSCQADRNVDAFACSNKSSSPVWLLKNMTSLHLLPQHIILSDIFESQSDGAAQEEQTIDVWPTPKY